MRKAFFLLAMIGLTSSLWAADPIIGTWELNIDKSQIPDYFESPIKSQKEIYVELDSGYIKMTLTREFTDGSNQVSTIRWPSVGGIVESDSSEGQDNSSEEELLVETFVAPGEWHVTRMREGIQYGLMYKVVSKDGKSYRLTFMRVNDKGTLDKWAEMVFERQP
jgi:hypothetical protein